MNFTVPVYQSRDGSSYELTTLGLGPHTLRRQGPSAQKAQTLLLEQLRRLAEGLKPGDLPWLQLTRGTRLERVRLDLTLRGGGKKRRFSGLCPLIVEPRWASDDRRLTIAYHPRHQDDWFAVDDEPLDQLATLFLQRAWADLTDDEVRDALVSGKDVLKMVSFSSEVKGLLDQSQGRPRSVWQDLESDPARTGQKSGDRPKAEKLLPRLAVDLTTRALEGGLRPGLPRSPQRERLQQLLGGTRRQSTAVVGPSGSGKTTLVHQWVLDQIAADDFPSHRNPDRLCHVWALSGRRLIAGMSHLGEWEQQAMGLLDEVRSRRVVLLVDDLAHFGRLGRSRDSDRCLADLLAGPVGRGEVVVVGECTGEQWRALEDDAPAFAALFTRVIVPEATRAETFRMLLGEARRLEQTEGSPPLGPRALRAALELGAALFPNRAMPGKALEVLRQLAQAHASDEPGERPDEIDEREVVALLARKTGLPEVLLRADEPLTAADLTAALGQQVIGQPGAVAAACDLILRIKAGLVDPRRPCGVLLFTGPTGTGKTELAKGVAEYLYGSTDRLLRFDMSEFGGPDAPSRLIGDRWQPEGLLTQRVQEQPFCVVLLDEIEKAHPSVLNLLLQLFDEGRLTSASGATASFTHAVVIMTSNLGARSTAPVGFGDAAERVMADVAHAVREFFPPELFNRIDRIVPFSPLTREVAAAVALKEMNRLFGRRGLTDRNVFVYVTATVAERVAREAFAQADGARSLKRYIDSRIGAVLAAHITRGGAAAMQVVRLFEANDALQIEVEPLREAEPAPGPWALEPLMDEPLEGLQRWLPTVLAFLRQLDGEALVLLSEQIAFHLDAHNQSGSDQREERSGHAEQLYHLDAIRGEIEAFRARVEALAQPPSDPHEQIEVQQFSHVEVTIPGYSGPRGGTVRRSRLLDRRAQERPPPRPGRDDVLEALAEAVFLRQALGRVHDPARHAVFIELARASRGAPAGRFARPDDRLLRWLARAYGEARGQLEEAVVRLDGGDVIELRGQDLLARLESWMSQGAERVVLRVVGLCVLDFFELETGSHVWQSLADQPEIVQVRVHAAPPGASARGCLDAHDEARRRFDESLGRGDPLPNPDRLLPAVRKLRFEPPRRPGAVALLEVEDYVLGHGAATWVREVADALVPLWRLSMSRGLRLADLALPRP
ncbi:MAG: ATP-dependent Clp protease ATP-binding subunit [Myxococcales bacterium]|nr:MAG: ATP-dependent Clp protease ATP-binding subunit [Myxococcales bacterium]